MLPISEVASFVPSEKIMRTFKINLDASSSTGKAMVTEQELQKSKTNNPISEKDEHYPAKKDKNRLRKKKKNAILNMPEGTNATDALRHNGVHTKPLHKKLTPSQKKSMLAYREMNDDYYDEHYIGLPAPVGGFKNVGSFRHSKKVLLPLPSQEQQFKQSIFLTSQFDNNKNRYKASGFSNYKNDNNNNRNNAPFNSFMKNKSAPKGNEISNSSLASNTFNELYKTNDTMGDYGRSNNKNNTVEVEHPEKESYIQYQAPIIEHNLNERKLQEQQLDRYFELKDYRNKNQLKSTESLCFNGSTNSNTHNTVDSTDLNAAVSLIQMAINSKDKNKRKKNLSAMDLLALVQAALKDNEDTDPYLESDADIGAYQKISGRNKKKNVDKKIKGNKKKSYHSSSDTETETEISDTYIKYNRKKKTKKKITEGKSIKNKHNHTVSDSDSKSEFDSDPYCDSDLGYCHRSDRYNNRMKINLLKYQPDFDLEDKKQRQRRRYKKEKKEMEKLMLKYESENSSDSNSDSDYYYTVNGFKGKLKNTVSRKVKKENDAKIPREVNRKKASKKKPLSNWDYSDTEYLTKKEIQKEVLKEMEENYNQMKKEFLKMKMTIKGLKNKKILSDITVEEPEGIISESDSQRHRPKLLTYSNKSSGDSHDYKKKLKPGSKSMDFNDDTFSNYEEKKVKKFKSILDNKHKSNSESEFDSDYYEPGVSKAKTESKPNPVDSFDKSYSDFKNKTRRIGKKYKEKPLKIRSGLSDSDSDSDSQFDDNKNSEDKTKSRRKIKSKLRSFSSASELFTDYEEKKKMNVKGKKKKITVVDPDSDSDSGSDFYEVKASSKGKSKPDPMDSADESFSDYEEKKFRKLSKVNRRR